MNLVPTFAGTGKTHTVVGILNTWHTVQYRRHQSAWLEQAAAALSERLRTVASAVQAGEPLGHYTSRGHSITSLSDLQDPVSSPKPRILVCAPSNAATDELLERILRDGFMDFSGSRYYPNVVRVGSEVSQTCFSCLDDDCLKGGRGYLVCGWQISVGDAWADYWWAMDCSIHDLAHLFFMSYSA